MLCTIFKLYYNSKSVLCQRKKASLFFKKTNAVSKHRIKKLLIIISLYPESDLSSCFVLFGRVFEVFSTPFIYDLRSLRPQRVDSADAMKYSELCDAEDVRQRNAQRQIVAASATDSILIFSFGPLKG